MYADFETEGIKPRPEYPPKPVGCALKEPGQPARYLAWGHPTENNCTEAQAKAQLVKAWKGKLCFHNAKFDLDVGEVHLGLAPPKDPTMVEDTGILGFFDTPRAFSHKLKDLAKAKLGIQPTERDELKAWILEHVPEAKKKKSEWGAYISKAPGALVGRYAMADVTMTESLHEAYAETASSMASAYVREQKLLYVLLDMERHGVPVDAPRLSRDLKVYDAFIEEKLDPWIRKRLKAPKELNVDSDQDLAECLSSSGKIADDAWHLTPKGQRSVSADALKATLAPVDPELFGALQWRGTCMTALNTFMRNWLEAALRTGGTVHPEWNQFKEKGLGTKSGRLSSSPNFQNISTELEKIDAARPKWCLELPRVRSYIVAPKGYVFIDRDLNSQEYRLFAHYEGDQLAKAYRDDPWQDVHQFVTQMINEAIAGSLQRRDGKTLNFGMLYGQGAKRLAQMLGVDLETAKSIIGIYLRLFPGVKSIRSEMDRRDRLNQPITTLGGRIYWPEPPTMIKKHGVPMLQRWGYKLVNLLIQAGSADYTKEAMVQYHYHPKRRGRIAMQVHDELLVLVKKEDAKAEMALLKQCMEENPFDLSVPMLSNGYVGPNFYDLKELPRGQ